MSSVNPNEEGDSDSDTPRTHRNPAGEHDRTDFTPIASTTASGAALAVENAVDVSAPTYDPSQTSQSLYSNRLRSHHRYQEPDSAGLPSHLQSFPASATSASHYITRLPPPIGLAESPLNQYRVLNRLAARPPSGTAGSVSSVSRAGSGYGAEGEASGLTVSLLVFGCISSVRTRMDFASGHLLTSCITFSSHHSHIDNPQQAFRLGLRSTTVDFDYHHLPRPSSIRICHISILTISRYRIQLRSATTRRIKGYLQTGLA
jgi:hypothetical protein